MKYLKILHNKAMELVDEAKIAKMGKDVASSAAFFRTAFTLEKYVALNFKEEDKSDWFRYVLLRSAAALAIDCQEWEEAEKLLKIAKEGTPPDFVMEQIITLEQGMKKTGATIDLKDVSLTGVLTHANAKGSEIVVEDTEQIQSYNIHVPENQISMIVKSFWLDKVVIAAKSSANGLLTLETITKAA